MPGKVAGAGVGPLAGKRVLVTRARDQAQQTCRLLEARGATAVCLPTLTLEPIAGALDREAEGLAARPGAYDYVIVTSANAVPLLHAALTRHGLERRDLAGVTLCAIGEATAAALGEVGLPPDLVPEDHRAEGMIALLAGSDVTAKRVLIPRAEAARELLPDTLRARGAIVDVVPVYRVVLPGAAETAEGLAALRSGGVDVVTFTSGATVENFCAIVGPEAVALCARSVVAAIGPVTRDACAAAGIPVHVIPPRSTLPDLVEALGAYLAARAEEERDAVS